MASKNDSIMVTLGLVVLIIALMGSAAFEGEGPGSDSILFDVVIDPKSEVILTENGDTNEGDSWNSPMDVTSPMNITSIVFTLIWDDDDTSSVVVGGSGFKNNPDTFTLSITSNNGTTLEATGSNDENSGIGTLVLNFTFMKMPSTDLESAASVEELEEKYSNDSGHGMWNITVTCDEAGDGEENTITGIQYSEDDGNDWSLEVQAHCYQADITEYDAAIE